MGACIESEREKKRKKLLPAVSLIRLLVFEIKKKKGFLAAGNRMGHACA